MSLSTTTTTTTSTRNSHLLHLPTELQFQIIEEAITLLPSSLFQLAVICSQLSRLVDAILYRRVVLRSQRALTLFAKTTAEGGNRDKFSLMSRNVGACVRNLMIGDIRPFRGRDEAIRTVLDACPNLYYLCLHSSLVEVDHPLSSSSSSSSLNPTCLSSLNLTLTNLSSLNTILPFLPHTTHLHISEPPLSERWVDPLTLFTSSSSSIDHLSNITHISLPRRENSNIENDHIFIASICTMFDILPNLEKVVVNVLPATIGFNEPDSTDEEGDEEALIWGLISEVTASKKGKIVGRKAKWGNWENEWEDDGLWY